MRRTDDKVTCRSCNNNRENFFLNFLYDIKSIYIYRNICLYILRYILRFIDKFYVIQYHYKGLTNESRYAKESQYLYNEQ